MPEMHDSGIELRMHAMGRNEVIKMSRRLRVPEMHHLRTLP